MNELEVMGALVQSVIGNQWVASHTTADAPNLIEYYQNCIKSALNSAFWSGAMEDADDSVISSVYEKLTGLKYSDFWDEINKDMATAIAQNRAIVGLE